MRAALAVKADLYIARYPAALPAAARAAARHSALYAFDAEDFHQGDLPDGAEHDFERGLVRAIEERYLHEAAYVTAASPGIAAAYSASYGIPTPTTVLNVFPKSEAPDGPTEAGTKKPGPSVYWFSQTIGADRGLECAVEAVARAQSRPHLYLRGNPAVGYRDHLMALAARAGVDDRLHFEPIAPPSEMVRLAASYDVGLVGEIGHSANRQIALTNKQFTYVLAGLPSLVSNVPAHVDLARGLAPAMMIYRVNDADDLARCMDVCLLDPQALAAARARAFALGRERFTWEDQARKLLNVVEAALSADKGRGRGQTTCASR
jgi:glycosyltransferase involved in cell wall biosynthesis